MDLSFSKLLPFFRTCNSEQIFLQTDKRTLTYYQATSKIVYLSIFLADIIKKNFKPAQLQLGKLKKSLNKKEFSPLSEYRVTIGLLIPLGMDYVLLILACLYLKNRFPYLMIIPLNHHKPLEVLQQEIGAARINFVITDLAYPKRSSQFQVISFSGLKKICSHDFHASCVLLKQKVSPKYISQKIITKIIQHPFVGLFTSGSTGSPKLAIFSWKHFMDSAKSAHQFFPFQNKDAWLAILPFYHVSGFSLIARTIYKGSTLVFTETYRKEWWRAIARYKITHISIVASQLPTQVLLFSSKQKRNVVQWNKWFANLKIVLVGGGPVNGEIIHALNQFFKKISFPLFQPTYGLTESVAQVATYDGYGKNSTSHETTTPTSLMPLRILPNRKVKVHQRQIFIHKDTLFCGYYNTDKGEGIVCPWSKAGWFPTGDLGIIKDNYLYISGRKDRQFISGGENIYPEEIERAIFSYSYSQKLSLPIKQVCVIAVSNQKWGKVPIAIVEWRTNKFSFHKEYGDSLLKFLQSQLELYKVPKRFYVISSKFQQKIIGLKFSPNALKKEYQNNSNSFKLLFKVTKQ